MRHHHAKRIAVENPSGEPELTCGTHATGAIPALSVATEMHGRMEIHSVVLEVEAQPLVSAGLHDRRDIDYAALTDAHSERQLAGLELLVAGLPRVGSIMSPLKEPDVRPGCSRDARTRILGGRWTSRHCGKGTSNRPRDWVILLDRAATEETAHGKQDRHVRPTARRQPLISRSPMARCRTRARARSWCAGSLSP